MRGHKIGIYTMRGHKIGIYTMRGHKIYSFKVLRCHSPLRRRLPHHFVY